ncbi:phage holin [Sporosarcina koreensis]|uniref:phage holin n=1 Tax=Sporosarcina koreensis TaxID=334735 RepID=UPI000AF05825|nr:phage holin [Sporosarcina koreensis]
MESTYEKKLFWLAVVPAFLLVAQIITGWFGYELAVDLICKEATNFINAVFALLVILGVIVDPTVSGVSDSKQAMRYHKPKKESKR